MKSLRLVFQISSVFFFFLPWSDSSDKILKYRRNNFYLNSPDLEIWVIQVKSTHSLRSIIYFSMLSAAEGLNEVFASLLGVDPYHFTTKMCHLSHIP